MIDVADADVHVHDASTLSTPHAQQLSAKHIQSSYGQESPHLLPSKFKRRGPASRRMCFEATWSHASTSMLQQLPVHHYNFTHLACPSRSPKA